jgi:hypothetical protein
MAKFKCSQSGNTVEFFQEHEIAEMRKHGGYTEVPEVREVVEAPVVVEEVPVKTTSKKATKVNETTIDGA